MNKYVKTLIVTVIIVIVFVLAFVASGSKSVELISKSDYSKIVDKGGYVFYGDVSLKKELKEIAKDSDIEIGLVDSDKIKLDLDENTFYEYKDGKVVFDSAYDKTYEFKRDLAREGIYKNYVSVTLDEYKKIIKEDGYNFMFIGSETCSYCQKFKNSIKESLKDYNYVIYYLDIANFSQDESNELIATDDYMSKNEWGTPLNLLYKDGKRINVLNGYVKTSELVKFLKDNKVI